MRRPTLIGMLLLLACGRTAPFGLASGVSPAPRGTVSTARARLPSPRKGAAVFSDGAAAYVIGGERLIEPGPTLAEIVRYEPRADEVEVLAARLPEGRGQAAAAWTGEHAFIFGGRRDRHQHTDEIVRFTPSTGEVRVMNARLPTPRINMAAVWTGTRVLLAGGFDYGWPTAVLAYEPEADRVVVLGAHLSEGREGPAYCWDGASLWLVGGYTGAKVLDGVVRYDARADTVVSESARWPRPLWAPASLFDGAHLLVAGGADGEGQYHSTLEALEVFSGGVTSSALRLPTGHAGLAGTWVSNAGFLFGEVTGSNGAPQITDEIVRVEP